MLRDFILIVLGIILSFLDPFIKEFIRTTRDSGWSVAMTGAQNSWKGLIRVVVIVALIIIGMAIYDNIQSSKLAEIEYQRQMELIQPLIEQHERIIELLEANNVSRNTTTEQP